MNATAYRLIRSTQTTRGRLVFSGAVGVLVMLGALGLGSGSRRSVLADFVLDVGLGFLVPIVTLIFAVAALGDLAEDRTLVYLWLRPVERWRLTVSALAATLTPVLPLVVIPVGLAPTLAGRGELAAGAAVGAAVAATAYAALFLGLGLRTRRSLVWGVLYVLLWENIIASVSRDLSALSVRRYGTSVFAELGDVRSVTFAVDLVPALIALALATALGVALSTWLLQRQDVD